VSGNAISLSLADTATCTITNTSVNISPNISVDKSASPANLPQAGGDVTFTVKVTNNSALYDPFTLTSLVDDVYGDLTVLEEEPIKKNQLSSTCAVPQTILSKQTYTCTFTAHFNGIPDNQTFYEHDTVIASGIDDDNAGPSSNGTASDDAYVVQSPPIAVTNSSLCSFDTNPDPTVPGRQFKRLFTQDALNMPYYRLTATNPGQFYYNLSLSGTPGDVVHIALTLPWPFVTQGARPIHVYDSVGLQSATGGPSTPDDFCFVPGNETQVINKHVVLASNTLPSNTVQYGAISVPGGGYPKTAILEFDITIPATGFAYVNQHMDDGLKGPKVDVTGDGVADSLYYGNLKDNAVYPTSTGPNVGKVLIPELFNHTFSVAWTGGAVGGGSDTVQNDNEFKKNTGVAGRVTSDSTGDGIAGLTVQLFEGPTATGSPVFTATTDADGWYVMAYKHKGKETTYTVKVVTNVQALTPNPATTTLKANGFAEVNFVLP
jgi:hypothetical protein